MAITSTNNSIQIICNPPDVDLSGYSVVQTSPTTFSVTSPDGSVSTIDTGLPTSLSYNATTGDLTYIDENGNTTIISLPVENFLSASSYDPVTNILTLNLVDGTVFNINLTDLVDVETVTTLVDNGNGTYTYTSEDGSITTIVSGSGGDGFGSTTAVVNNGNGTVTVSDGLGNSFVIDVAGAETVTTLVDNGNSTFTYTSENGTVTTIATGGGGADGFGTTTSVVNNGDGTLTVSDGLGNSFVIDVSSAETVTTLVDNMNGSYTYTSEDGTVTVISTTGSTATAFMTHAVTWHHDAGTPSDVPFEVDLTSARIADAGWLGDVIAHGYFGPPGPVTISIIYSNDSDDPQTLYVQEIIDANFNTDYSAAPLTAVIGSTTLAAQTNGLATFTINPVAGNGSVLASIIYYYAEPDAGDVRILGIKFSP